MQRRTPFTFLSATALGCTLTLGAPTAFPPQAPLSAPAAQAHEEAHHTPEPSGTREQADQHDGEHHESAGYTVYEGNYVIAGVHTELLNAFLDGKQLTLGTLADTSPGEHGRFDPAHTVFHLPDVEDAHTTVNRGYDYIGPEGTDIFYIPSTRTSGLLYPGLGAEGIAPGALKDNSITLELVRSSVPEGARAEVFTESGRDNPRVFSTADRLEPHTIGAGGHEHLSWAFTRAGVYRLTFRASATLADGTPVTSEATYTIAVGVDPEDAFEAGQDKTRDTEATPAPSPSTSMSETPDTGSTTGSGAGEGMKNIAHDTEPAAPQAPAANKTPQASDAADTAHPAGTDSFGSTLGEAGTIRRVGAATTGTQAGAASVPQTPMQEATNATQHTTETPKNESDQVKDRSVKGSNAQNITVPGDSHRSDSNGGSNGGILSSGQPGSLNQQCIATEVPVNDPTRSTATTQNPATGQKESAKKQAAPENPQASSGEATLATITNAAEHSGREEVTHGHFDVGPVLNGDNLTSSVKDDRTSPARHVSPGTLEFVLNDAAKLKLPSGMENIAPAGTPVHMIGATQQQGVPWLGWSTQDPELLKQLDGPVTMTLNGFDGPGNLSVFLSGNFGSAGQRVFDSRGGGSFQVPANTHQHSNWVFTAEGRYTVTIGWSARLKNGRQVSSESTLHFTVGTPNNTSTSGNTQNKSVETRGDSNKPKPTSTPESEKTPAKDSLNGTVDEATGIVTKPDGTKVRIVGKTASGEDCALTGQELANAQKTAAAGKLPHTGAGVDPFMISTSLLALALGAVILRSARRATRSRKGAQ